MVMKEELYWSVETKDGGCLYAKCYEDAYNFAKDVAEISGENVRIYEHKLVCVMACAKKEGK